MSDAFHVRLANPADHARVDELARAAGLELASAAELEKPWAALWVGAIAGEPVASYALTWQVADEIELVQIATAPEFRRRGAARAVLQALLVDARSKACGAAYLEVRRSNGAALCLYRALGFETGPLRLRYYSDGEDAVQMRHSLGS
jgi:ribosomal-protein-alanine N-acetyltransferase